jgi:hypothetical protein
MQLLRFTSTREKFLHQLLSQMGKTDEKIVLLPDVAKQFEVVNTEFPTLHSKIGFIDFRTMNLEQAEALVKSGSGYLKKKENAVVE